MVGRSHILFGLITIAIPRLLFSQNPGLAEQQMEDLLFRDESAEVPVEFFETQADHFIQPLDLNNVTQEQLDASGLFTPFQVHVIMKYREEFGELFSIYELAGLTGFSDSRIRSIEACLSVNTGTGPNTTNRGQTMILINAGKILPEADGYRSRKEDQENPAYTGSPIKTSLRVKTDIGGNLSFGLSYEKDAGEPFINNSRPEYLSGHISYQGNRIIKQLVVGDFQLQHGLGLVNGTGFIQSPESYQFNRLSISKLKPYASMNEYKFEQGIGCRMDLKKAELLVWTSYQHLDLSLGGLQQNLENTTLLDHQRKTGMHRTANELGGRSLGYRFHSGFQTTVQHKNLTVGYMVGIEKAGLTQMGLDSLKFANEPFIRGISSLHGKWYLGRLELFGEFAARNWESKAILLGSRYHFNDFFQGLLILHRYEPTYKGVQPSSYASGSNINNEQGATMGFHMEPGTIFTSDFIVELFSFPSPSYLNILPSTGYRYSCTFKNAAPNILQWKFRISKKVWQTTPKIDELGLRELKNSAVTRFDIRLAYNPESNLEWQSRLLLSLFSGNNRSIPGHAAVQQLNIGLWQSLNCTFQFVIFNVRDWDNRIYIYEPGFYYSFNFPVYYGSGQKVTLLISQKSIKRITLTGKVSKITYHDRGKIGSGNDLITGNKKWEIGLQLRLKL